MKERITIELDGVSWHAPDREVLRGLSYTFRPGMTYVLGDNGSGKSTLLKLLTTVVPPCEGTIGYYAESATGRSARTKLSIRDARSRIGYLPQRFAGYPELTTDEYLLHQALQKGFGPREARRLLPVWLEASGLEAVKRVRLGRLSDGQRQRVGLLQAMLAAPVCLLDEPFEGLDVLEGMALRHLAVKLARSRTVVVSTHRLEWIDGAAGDRLALLRGGSLHPVGYAGDRDLLRALEREGYG
ncbi:hypothetical protein J31TS4_17670 [Paenibacillus sp. J31TS4]|uniref:ATP-binding cassette domain-containing protein n=1 Tax=Paenibacillus sp. J31TS4 TaxID=2807195 RepID=UPI001B012CF2|nr:ATP-binding cassette domain-containing protein [Paenibacillus sp. J31TS4]GIP38487.1 hypothetical protein J31TS4_17670 [Paenibacillus sp. J31TS4]